MPLRMVSSQRTAARPSRTPARWKSDVAHPCERASSYARVRAVTTTARGLARAPSAIAATRPLPSCPRSPLTTPSEDRPRARMPSLLRREDDPRADVERGVAAARGHHEPDARDAPHVLDVA